MVKLVALFSHPANVQAFNKHFDEVHLPLIQRVPGLARIELARVTGGPRGVSPYHMIVELFWNSAADMQASIATAEMREVGRDARAFAGHLLSMHIAEVVSRATSESGSWGRVV